MTEKAGLYARVSTKHQDLENQEEKLINWAEMKGYDYDLYSEKVSSIKERPQFENLIKNAEKYDIIACTKVDRFGRSVQDILEKINELKRKGCDFQAIDQPIVTSDDMYGDFMLKILSVVADFERQLTRRRMEEGFEKAMEKGTVGRPETLSDDDKDALKAMYKQGASYRYLSNYFNVSKSTIRKKLNEMGLIGDR